MNRLLSRESRAPLLFGLLAGGLLAALLLRLNPLDLWAGTAGWELAGKILGGAFRPALDYEAARVPEGAAPLWWKILGAAGRTLLFAIAALSLGAVLGVPLAVLGSESAWRGWPVWLGRLVRPPVRLFQAALRSVHELLWAVLFLAAFGLSDLTAVLALAIPYAGILSKIYGEVLDETPVASQRALLALGGNRLQAFTLGLLPRALPDLVSYTFYRLECAVRASAVLGFVGISTLGLYLRQSFENGHYREVWSYLYALLLLVFLLDLWSSTLRRRLK